MDAFQSMFTVFLAFTFQYNVFPIYFSLKNMNRNEMIKVTKIGVEFCFLIFLIIGIVDFSMYSLRMNNTILKELNNDMIKYKNIDSFIKFLIIFINISFIISTLTCFPINFLSLKENFLNSIIFCKKYCHLEIEHNNNSQVEKNVELGDISTNNVHDTNENLKKVHFKIF